MMTIAEQERARSRKYEALLPEMVAALAEGRAALDVARELAEHHGIDIQESFRWVHLTEEEIEAFRRRRAVMLVIPVWVLGMAAVALGVMALGGIGPLGTAGALWGALAGAAGAGIYSAIILRRGSSPWQAWLVHRNRHLQGE